MNRIGGNRLQKPLNVPVRMCVSCRGRGEKYGLIRVVRYKDAEICVDPSGKSPGRGAYICKSAQCVLKAQKERRFNRAFKCEVNQTVYNELLNIIDGGDRNDK